jgi:hypothetical protein
MTFYLKKADTGASVGAENYPSYGEAITAARDISRSTGEDIYIVDAVTGLVWDTVLT